MTPRKARRLAREVVRRKRYRGSLKGTSVNLTEPLVAEVDRIASDAYLSRADVMQQMWEWGVDEYFGTRDQTPDKRPPVWRSKFPGKLVPVSIRPPKDLLARIDAVAEDSGLGRSEAAQQLLESAVDAYTTQREVESKESKPKR